MYILLHTAAAISHLAWHYRNIHTITHHTRASNDITTTTDGPRRACGLCIFVKLYVWLASSNISIVLSPLPYQTDQRADSEISLSSWQQCAQESILHDDDDNAKRYLKRTLSYDTLSKSISGFVLVESL